ncbi:MAG: Cof-type HAD-IIB family hydrolase [candidate division KSB1 bacterium]|nr:Cof-type HAD-IIB family hydrolase [candidate division KSB1 bacterium]MDZ7334365.1 Cof-type HAD-IIB family hydrolase [candidate division KSB1 bacterium]MDZ7356406.1 Cof-type HAD-IIB family hydrolase [candidate division KSB1 bacterium]MDZ7399286.1 Cof-type HAD-IIB family hydrolase [candidate division KSB1 bacterium]
MKSEQYKKSFFENMISQPLIMVVSDLDGTLLGPDHRISEQDYQLLQLLKTKNVYRVVATGRSVYSANKVLPTEFPIDYLIFSSGAGVMDWTQQEILLERSLTASETAFLANFLIQLKMDFMIQMPIPDNHHFLFFDSQVRPNPDFWRRIEIYQGFAAPLQQPIDTIGASSEFVVIIPDGVTVYDQIKCQLPQFNVIRATSALDGKSIWVEILPKNVSKATATAWLCERLGCPREMVLGIGNDYNDLDLLNWTGHSFVVENAPIELKNKFRCTASNAESGFSHAVREWFPQLLE